MKLKIAKYFYHKEAATCQNCGNVFKGKVCNECGEKIFDEHQLTTKHFLHEVIDFFYHFENKVLKTIKLNFLKPGFVTKENLRGVRVPYAKPVQLYLVVAVMFYIGVSKVGVTDYIPSYGDHRYYYLSDYTILKWAKPVDDWTVASIDTLWAKKGREFEELYSTSFDNQLKNDTAIKLYTFNRADSFYVAAKNKSKLAQNKAMTLRSSMFSSKIGTFAKSLIFIILPFFAAFLFFFFFKKIKYYGAALVFSTHFMVYNLCCYTIYALIDVWPQVLSKGNFGGWLFAPFVLIFYNKYTTPFSDFLFGSTFGLVHFIFWMPWLYIAFKRLFNTPWWKNLIISFICCKVFFFLIFGVLKKILIAFTIWSMHV